VNRCGNAAFDPAEAQQVRRQRHLAGEVVRIYAQLDDGTPDVPATARSDAIGT
jgi:hypothetical protein